MPPRALASATISFGLVAIPVKLFTSTEAGETLSFRMLHAKCHHPLKRPYWCPNDQEMVDRDDIVKGYEYAKEQFVLFTDDEVKALEEEATRAIDINEFVALDEVDPVYFDKAYYLGPDKGGERPYKLLSMAMREKKIGGLAKYAARGKQYLVFVRPFEDGLVLQQLRYANEVRAFGDVPVGDATVKPGEMKLALQLIEQSMSDAFHPENYEDEVRTRILEVIQQKVDGQEVTFAPGESPAAQVIDLMEALKASLGGGAGAPKAEPAKKAAKARKPAKASPRKKAKKTGTRSRKTASG
jgi:DNA end-binding protein Ku